MNKTFIIAEAGVNHNGSLKIAKQMIDVASTAGADAVKFQTFTAEKLVSRVAPKAEYQKLTTKKTETQFEMIKKLELDLKSHKELIQYCKK
jgi:N,N'-diacetyllegionaminate synthase